MGKIDDINTVVEEGNLDAIDKVEENNNTDSENAIEEGTNTEIDNEEEKRAPVEVVSAPNGYVETLPANEPIKTFQVVEIKEDEKNAEENPKPKRVYRKRTTASRKTAAEA